MNTNKITFLSDIFPFSQSGVFFLHITGFEPVLLIVIKKAYEASAFCHSAIYACFPNSTQFFKKRAWHPEPKVWPFGSVGVKTSSVFGELCWGYPLLRSVGPLETRFPVFQGLAKSWPELFQYAAFRQASCIYKPFKSGGAKRGFFGDPALPPFSLTPHRSVLSWMAGERPWCQCYLDEERSSPKNVEVSKNGGCLDTAWVSTSKNRGWHRFDVKTTSIFGDLRSSIFRGQKFSLFQFDVDVSVRLKRLLD
jgi:hypothetical protein